MQVIGRNVLGDVKWLVEGLDNGHTEGLADDGTVGSARVGDLVDALRVSDVGVTARYGLPIADVSLPPLVT